MIDKLLIVYCSVVPHDHPPKHRLNFVTELSNHAKVIFVDLPTNKSINHWLSYFGYLYSVLKHLYKFDGYFYWPFLKRDINYLILRVFLLIQKYFFKRKIILYTTFGYLDRVYKFIPFDKSIFDCPDVHRGEFRKNKNWIKKFDLVFTNTNAVYCYAKKYNDNVKSVSSGYLKNYRLPKLNFKNKDSVLFLGGISQRIDYDLLIHVVDKLPSVKFYFIGEIYLNKYYKERTDVNRLKKWNKILTYPNAYYLGSYTDEKLKSELSKFKIGIIPYYTSNVFDYYSNPIKLYEYLRYGMYVISTPLPNVLSIKNNLPVYISKTPNDFVNKIKTVLQKNNSDFKRSTYDISKLLKIQGVKYKVGLVLKELEILIHGKIIG